MERLQNYKLRDITTSFLALSVTAFGGPSVHVAMFMDIFVVEKRWLSAETFAELFAIAQSLPGPASTQLAYCIALLYAGPLLAFYSFLLWSLPGAILMTSMGIAVNSLPSEIPAWLNMLQNGLTSSAVGLIALAAYRLSQKLNTTKLQMIISFLSACFAISISAPWLYPCLMIAGGLLTALYDYLYIRHEYSPLSEADLEHAEIVVPYSMKTGGMIILAWIGVLIGSLIIRIGGWNRASQVFGTFFFTGSIIFGGGPVVIPLLNAYTVTPGWLTEREFLLGLAIISACPGPMFNFAAFLGALSMRNSWGLSIIGATMAYLGIFLPGLALKSGVLPFWKVYRQKPWIKSCFKGVNSAAVGLVFAATYLLWQKAIVGRKSDGSVDSISNYPIYVSICSFAFLANGSLNLPSPIVIILGGVISLLPFIL